MQSEKLAGQSEKLRGAENKLNKLGKQGLSQADKLITKIGARENKNNIIIAFVISCCLALLVFHYDFLGLGKFKAAGDPPLLSAKSSKASQSISSEDI